MVKHAVATAPSDLRGERASLRALDWRYLLPRPPSGAFERLVLLGGSEALAERIREQGVARAVSRAVVGDGTADALVALYPARLSWRDVARCLAPGGVFYAELQTPPWPGGWTMHRLRRRLSVAGLTPYGAYWVRPGLTDRQMYVPLDPSGALHWCLDTLHAPATLTQGLLAAALRRLTAFRSLPGSLPLTSYAVTGARGARRPAGFIFGAPVVAQAGQDQVYPLVITAGHDGNRVAVLPFARAGRHPLAVLKVARHPALNHRVTDEQAALGTLAEMLDDQVRRTIPQPLGSFAWGNLNVGVESCAPGRPLSSASPARGVSPRQRHHDLRQAVAWLTCFNQRTRTGSGVWGQAEVEEWVERPLAAYAHHFGLTPQEETLFGAVRHRANALRGAALPLVWVHWGFDERNIFRQGDQLTVIDWEGGSPGPPLYDLLYFVTRWSYGAYRAQDAAARQACLVRLFCTPRRDDPVQQAVHGAVDGYLSDLGLDPRCVSLFLVTMLVQRALGRVDYQVATQSPVQALRQGNEYVESIGRLAAHVERLFEIAGEGR